MKQICDELYFLGLNNPQERIFEGEIPLLKGMSYNSYLYLDKATCLLDTIEVPLVDKFIEELQKALNGRKLDYFVIHHLEPDHTGGIVRILELFPDVEVYISPMGLNLLKQFFPFANIHKHHLIKEGDTLSLGKHQLVFFNAPMVHWPEVVMSYDPTIRTLFSADGFGSFTIFDELDSSLYPNQDELIDEARRYYTNIVGKYGEQVLSALTKASKFSIERICPLHGPIHTKLIPQFLDLYTKWASYMPEKDGVLVVSASVYGHTHAAAQKMVELLNKKGVTCEMVNLNQDDVTLALSKSFIYQNVILFCSTFNMFLFPKMEQYLSFLVSHNIQNKTFGFVENGSWAPQAKRLMQEKLKCLPKNRYLDTSLTIKSALKDEDVNVMNKMIEELFSPHHNDIQKAKKHHFKCKICGFILEADCLPSDFVCPICGRRHDDFEQVD